MDFGPIFGDGHMKAPRLPATRTVCGVIIVMPRLDDGSGKFRITEEPKTIQCLLEDDIFTQITREGDAMIPAAISQSDNAKTTLRANVARAYAVDNAFCARADLKERKKMSVSEIQEFLVVLRDMFSRLAALPIPTIACESGLALDGGL
ncbi:uncharacterized protein Triagg1_835 [Trichoderma aggressivum f. europaeum]|uniref:Uncharacterized protein n=1 Tax=Trichoderma aggressivum f. europaeum TaxID=173218 RepID=A0AAE1IM99_9HYPO|nr:hypothetical protein Triagg1_835 [Trichoderma aggressivum f. europaeum]